MALVINDRVKVTSTTTGTGAFALGVTSGQGLKLLHKVLEITIRLTIVYLIKEQQNLKLV